MARKKTNGTLDPQEARGSKPGTVFEGCQSGDITGSEILSGGGGGLVVERFDETCFPENLY